jgi:two-component system, NtrC family, nitrogen regulation sensor histidine kinase NtrY
MTSNSADMPPSLWRQVAAWAARVGLANKLAVTLTIAAIGAGFATYGALTASPPFGNDPNTVSLLLTLDLALLLLLGSIVARRIVGLWAERRRGLAGSRLHVRLVGMFSLLAAMPAIVMAAFAAVFFYVGIQSWFSERVRTAINESLEVAEAYLHEHQQVIRADALAMANDLNREVSRLIGDPQRFAQVVTTQAALRSLTEAVVFDGSGRMLARSGLSFTLEFDPIPETALERARDGEVVLMVGDTDDRVRALVRLDRFVDTFLFVGRLVDPRVLGHMENAQQAASSYAELEGKRSSLQITFTLIFVVVALLLLMAAVWLGLHLATTLVSPISSLILAAERVRAGDMSARVPELEPEDEIGSLSRAFNRMTSQLESQRRELIEANRQLDLRRRFTEAVLSGVSAGVVGLDAEGRINLPNSSAAQFLGVDDPESLTGRKLVEVVPEMGELIGALKRRPNRLMEGQVQLRRAGAPVRTLLVRISAESHGNEIRGFVVTFDDVTELLSAQRKAAWADVARRIAHEIKNPLTPIQLSAERLRRKYLKEISSDPDTFQICTDTIIRQVGDIGRMVDEFSAFARMPSPVMKPQNVNELCRQAVFLQSSAHPDIRYTTDLPQGPLTVPCDGRQISQALTNLLQNAADAIEGRVVPEGTERVPGQIHVAVAADEEQVVIILEDNGKGLPVEERDRLTEPYVTTRAKGTGLGLAIVKKIMEDHGGELLLADREGCGARVKLVIPRNGAIAPPASEADGEGAGNPAGEEQQRQIRYGA